MNNNDDVFQNGGGTESKPNVTGTGTDLKAIHEKQEQERQKMKNAMKAAKEAFAARLHQYLDSVPSVNEHSKTKEFEIRFGKYHESGHITSKIDYDNVIKYLTAAGFYTKNKDGLQILRIFTKYQDPKTGQTKDSNVRVEIADPDEIADYCASNSLEKSTQASATTVKFTQKTSPIDKDGKYQSPIDFPDSGFRVDYKYEQDFTPKSIVAKRIMDKWADNKKKFRLINRVRFQHDEHPVFADISIVKTSSRVKGRDLYSYTIQESNVFDNPESYEIELEIDNSRVGQGQDTEVMDHLRKVIRTVMSGIQRTNYPIPLSERDDVLQEYLQIVHGEQYKPKRIGPNDFIGPSSYTLQMANIVSKRDTNKVANIRDNYTVTDKADGERKLMYIDKRGHIYLLDVNMNVQFTGAKTDESVLFHSVLDGEHILFDKMGDFINLYKAFDVYFVNTKSFVTSPFVKRESDMVADEAETESKQKQKDPPARLTLLNQFIQRLKPKSILPENSTMKWKEAKKDGKPIWLDIKTGKTQTTRPSAFNPGCKFRVECKEFYIGTRTNADAVNAKADANANAKVDDVDDAIFDGCARIMSNIRDGLFEYNTDGLIFTPAYSPVGSIAAGLEGPLHKYTWEKSFKWKPAEFNTVDFLVEVYKENGREKIQHIFEDGANTAGTRNIIEYKTLILRCGFSTKKHMFENAFNDILHERLPNPGDVDNEDTYEPRPFEPTDPYDPLAWKCNVIVKSSGDDERNAVMTTESGEYFQDNMIVEFRYDRDAEPGWNWIPIRVRYDKTQKLLRGMPEYGNAYHVANSNWHSIHHPITEAMVTTGRNIPESEIADSDAYYMGSKEDSKTVAMRNFHNLYVKRKLIMGPANQGDTLIDYAVGKAGDLSKWRQARLSMVFGIDLSRDNVSGATDSASVRYLKECQKYSQVPYCLFLKGDSGLNIRSMDAFPGDKTSKERMVASAIFGKGPKDHMVLGKGVYNRYGIGEPGFQISSCQFAIHYFCENAVKLNRFVRNLAECTRIQGYFVCTGYDGRRIFDLLKRKKEGEGVSFMASAQSSAKAFADRRNARNNTNKKRICEIIKKYTQDGFAEDETSLGYAIHVYQETIEKTSVEYLVPFKYLVRVLENYGFELVSNDDAQQMGLPHGSGLFDELYSAMENEIQRDPNSAMNYKSAMYMSDVEKQISFLNRYCMFRKTTTVSKETMDNFEKIAIAMDKQSESLNGNDDYVNEGLHAMMAKVASEQPPSRGNVRKIRARMVLGKKQKIGVELDDALELPNNELPNTAVDDTNLMEPGQTSVLKENTLKSVAAEIEESIDKTFDTEIEKPTTPPVIKEKPKLVIKPGAKKLIIKK